MLYECSLGAMECLNECSSGARECRNECSYVLGNVPQVLGSVYCHVISNRRVLRSVFCVLGSNPGL